MQTDAKPLQQAQPQLRWAALLRERSFVSTAACDEERYANTSGEKEQDKRLDQMGL